MIRNMDGHNWNRNDIFGTNTWVHTSHPRTQNEWYQTCAFCSLWIQDTTFQNTLAYVWNGTSHIIHGCTATKKNYTIVTLVSFSNQLHWFISWPETFEGGAICIGFPHVRGRADWFALSCMCCFALFFSPPPRRFWTIMPCAVCFEFRETFGNCYDALVLGRCCNKCQL